MAPNPTIKHISRTKISDEPGYDKCYVTVSFDVPVQGFSVNAIGVSWDTGMICHWESRHINDLKNQKVSDAKLRTVQDVRQMEGDLVAEIDYTEIYQEGDNRINIYGQDLNGNWTPHAG